ncbi:MAG: PBP1A family penicillin-binding protein [Paracoccaceae bacterium]|nr:PBP1A family penicillin-binding protein [Paracoccaceae bacterium]
MAKPIDKIKKINATRDKKAPNIRKKISGAPRKKTLKKKNKNKIKQFFLKVLRWFLWLFWFSFSRSFILLSIILIGFIIFEYSRIGPLNTLIDARSAGSVTLLDKHGQIFAWRGNQFGGVITANEVSPHLKNAVVAAEDRRFYKHFGISPRGIASAIRINIREGRSPLRGHGGSTITQQVAKILCLGSTYDKSNHSSETDFEKECRRNTIFRKLREIPFSIAMELKFTKDEILMIYLNRVYLGAGNQGFEAASIRYFDKSAKYLNPAESAMLAGLLVAPSYYAPTRNLNRAQQRATVVLDLMKKENYLTQEIVDNSKKYPAKLSPKAKEQFGSHFADWVTKSSPSFLTQKANADIVVKTTFDTKIQNIAEKVLIDIFKNEVSEESEAQASVIVMSSDGAVRAMIGGRDTKVSGQFNRATQAIRQTGSLFKPFVYAAALEQGYKYNSKAIDEEITIDVPYSGLWTPKNYTNEFYGKMTISEALAKSINTIAVKTAMLVGLDSVRNIANDFGISGNLAPGPALALGASESSLLEMTGAYAGILSGGLRVKPYGLDEITIVGEGNPIIGRNGGVGERVMEWENARQLIYMMNNVIETGSGRRAKIKYREAGGKTGTTQAMRDAWFIGFTADYVVGVWMGYDDNSPLKGVTGGGLPAQIWKNIMTKISSDLPSRPLPMINPRVANASFVSGKPPDIDASGLFKKIDKTTKSTNFFKSLFGRPEN